MAHQVLRLFNLLPVLLVILQYGWASISLNHPRSNFENAFGYLLHGRQSFGKYDLPPYPVENYKWRGPENLGQISGISVDPIGNPVVFHRGDRIWDYNTFNDNFEYQDQHRGPILQDTVLTLDPKTGDILDGWGSDMFYLPHGIHIDTSGNIWLTDVALHQVFKFQRGSNTPKLVMGHRFEPGEDLSHFCQPTSVAVAPTGEIVVADGYCNSRIMVFNSVGGVREVIPRPGDFVALRVPHSLAIMPENRDVCVADRENMRVICLDVGLDGSVEKRRPPRTIQRPDLGKVYAIASYANYLYAVDGPSSPMTPARGYILNPKFENIITPWGPVSGYFNKPHGIAVCPNGTALYVSEIGPNKIWKFILN
ncbi:peptidyl-alpha-hydroxyglycine alpha-amidating lyase 2 [Cephus cinctus]|uniref:peptidylamidoglycolate lyase n=1 Tax=Cephus cinctus TaxID=211228 RepID=A0AAJ7BRK5_CEPCN|nr:peptidyl-alpha-hydroxyglycine alpha-amidating lyase 2 [Cephus cinctus]